MPATLMRLERLAAESVRVISVMSRIGERTFRSRILRLRRKDIIRSRSVTTTPASTASQIQPSVFRSSVRRTALPASDPAFSRIRTGRHTAPPENSVRNHSPTRSPKLSGSSRRTRTASARASWRIIWL